MFDQPRSRVLNRSTYGTENKSAINIIELMLNSSIIKVYSKEKDKDTNKVNKVFDKTKTLLAMEKEELIAKEFNSWVHENKDVLDDLSKIYYETFGTIKTRHYNGNFLSFPSLNPSVKLRDYQKNAIARILFSPSTLLAHDVGAGKTYEMVAAIHELKRMNLASRIMAVVPNNIINQWKEIFLKLYNDANLLVVDSSNFFKGTRRDTLRKMKYDDLDCIIITYSAFDYIPTSVLFSDEKKEVSKKMLASYVGIFFEDLNIDALFIDEAHNYKNLYLKGSNRVLGVTSKSSIKCKELLNKVRDVQSRNGKIVFATGTPITNSLTDVFTMQKYLQPGELKLFGLSNFSDWLGTFCEKQARFEVDVTGSGFRVVSRYSRFHNLPELSIIFSSVIDTFTINKQNLPEFYGYHDIIQKSQKN